MRFEETKLFPYSEVGGTSYETGKAGQVSGLSFS